MRGEAAVIVATAAHCRAVEARLAAVAGFASARAGGRFTALGAVETLGQLLDRLAPGPRRRGAAGLSFLSPPVPCGHGLDRPRRRHAGTPGRRAWPRQ